jgi:rubrerythrin
MAYKDTKSFHKDFGDGGRKARTSIQKIAERKEQKYNRLDGAVEAATEASTVETTAMECNDCGYIGDKVEDFLPVAVAEEGGDRECPVCGSRDCQPYVEDDI